ncbi:MAG: hypothetical protein EOP06_12835 [Proteobacteria bacterium]|nr:MAG: hypothetical protein EOP06_12835 [Pseudomonadota bacterium]
MAGRCAILGINHFEIVEIDELTDGQATTVLAAKVSGLNQSGPIVIFNIDTHLNPISVSAAQPFKGPSILCFPGVGDAWSFARVDSNGSAIQVTEKVRVSDHASVGLYVFKDWQQYEVAYDKTYLTAKTPAAVKERYIAPMYNSMIEAGITVSVPIIGIEDVTPLGTPSEVRAFENQTERA